MCGITGMMVRNGLDADDLAEVWALSALMRRRGPDDQGEWDDGAVCALAFRRLSILDPSPRGHQPMVSDDGEHALVFNGEVYNFRELRADLQREGRTFRSSSDSEVVLAALERWGKDALARFNGMFALAWYQPRSRRLVLARDPVGIKPLAWWWSPEAFVFGSQYDQVVRHRRCDRRRTAGDVLRLYLRLGFVPAPYGLIEGTGQLAPGHWLEVTPGSPPRTGVFREPAAPAPPEEQLRGEAADEAVAEAVSRAVRRQAVSDVRLGTFLSGGVDSPLVTAELQAASAEPVPAFTIGTTDPETDEAAAARSYAGVLGVEHHLRTIDGDLASTLVEDVGAAYTEPFGDFSSLPTLLVSRLAAEHVKVVHSGDGGDELFWGYPRFAKVRAARPWFGVPRAVRTAGYAAATLVARDRRPARGVRFPSIGDWYLDAHSGLRDHDFARLAPGLPDLPADLTLFDLSGRPGDDALMQWMRTNELKCHLARVLHKVDRASMHCSLEVRVPLLDLEVVDLAARIAPDACVRSGVGKQVLRRALRRHVPEDRIPVPKKGFTVPLREWLRHELRGVAHDLLASTDLFPEGVFDPAEVRAMYEDHREGRIDMTQGLWNLLALQLWAARHLEPLPTTTTIPEAR